MRSAKGPSELGKGAVGAFFAQVDGAVPVTSSTEESRTPALVSLRKTSFGSERKPEPKVPAKREHYAQRAS